MARRKKTDDNQPASESQSSADDTFGLPEISYEPLRRDQPREEPESQPEPIPEPVPAYEPEATADEPASTPGESTYAEEPASVEAEYRYEPVQESSPLWPKVLGIVLVIVIALAAAYYFLVYQPQQEKARLAALKEQQDKEKREREELENRARLEREAAERRRLDSLAAIPKTGTIETLQQRTGKYYVVIASAVDVDLLTDYAKKLSEKGVSSKIIPPYGKYKVHRITIDEGDTFAMAQAKADGLKPEYGDALWVLKY